MVSCKYYVTLKVTLTFGVNGNVNAHSSFIAWFVRLYLRQFLTEILQIINCARWQRNFRLHRYYVIIIFFKLEFLRYLMSDRGLTYFSISSMMMTFISQNNTFYVTSGLAKMTSLSFQLLISLLLYARLSLKLVKEIWVVHITLRSYKISCDLEGHLDILGRVQGKWIFYLIVWFLLS